MVVLYWSWLRNVCRTSRPGGYRHPLQRIHREVGLACAGGEFARVARRVRQLEAVRLADLGVVVAAARHHGGDRVADLVVVVGERSHGTGWSAPEQRPRQLADDGHLAAHLVARRVSGCPATGAPSTSNPRRRPSVWRRLGRPCRFGRGYGRINAVAAVHERGCGSASSRPAPSVRNCAAPPR